MKNVISSIIIFLFLSCFLATAVLAEAIYLKDGTVLRGKIVKKDDDSVSLESNGTWRGISRSNIEFIRKDKNPKDSSAELNEAIYLKDGTISKGTILWKDDDSVYVEANGRWQRISMSDVAFIKKDDDSSYTAPIVAPPPVSSPTVAGGYTQQTVRSRTISDLRLKLGDAAGITKVSSPYVSLDFSAESSGNFQIEGNWGQYNDSNVGLIFSAGLFSRVHSGSGIVPLNGLYYPTTVDYEANGISLGVGVGIISSNNLHFEGKFEYGFGSGDGSMDTPGFIWNPTSDGPYTSASIIVGVYYTVSQPGFQIGLELGRQAFKGEYDIAVTGGGSMTVEVEGSGAIASLVIGGRF